MASLHMKHQVKCFTVEPTEADIAWAAGLFEGEGAICQDKKGRVRLSLKMTDFDCVRRFAEVVGGRVYGPYSYESKDGYKRQPWLLWHSDGTAPKVIIEQFWPWVLGRRRERAIEVGLVDPEAQSVAA